MDAFIYLGTWTQLLECWSMDVSPPILKLTWSPQKLSKTINIGTAMMDDNGANRDTHALIQTHQPEMTTEAPRIRHLQQMGQSTPRQIVSPKNDFHWNSQLSISISKRNVTSSKFTEFQTSNLAGTWISFARMQEVGGCFVHCSETVRGKEVILIQWHLILDNSSSLQINHFTFRPLWCREYWSLLVSESLDK